jgi:ubiquinone/menaquinone biosynthesis C-methylase UbiE
MDDRDHQAIYRSETARYEALVAREDYQHHILPALNRICQLDNRTVIELGAGTGRVTRLLASFVQSIRAFDHSGAMLALARQKLVEDGRSNWALGIADHRSIPVQSAAADLVIAGWSLCYLVTWNPDTWRSALTQALAEIKRVLRPGGTIILLETQGTGHERPHPPANLVPYYAFLENEAGFAATWIRTDYQFASPAEAVRLVRFFFGTELAEQVAAEQLVVLPECTGIWWWREEAR